MYRYFFDPAKQLKALRGRIKVDGLARLTNYVVVAATAVGVNCDIVKRARP
jgi:hypothetical protein